MPFDPTPEQLWEEIQAAMKETKQHTASSDSIIRRLCGRWYRSDQNDLEAEPENFGFSFISNMIPMMATENPQVIVNAARVVGHRTIAQAMQDGINAWVRDVDYESILQPVLFDYLVSRGILLHYLEEDTRWSRGIVTPGCKRIDPRAFFQDSLAEDNETDRFRGHWYFEDIENIVNDPDANPDVVQSLQPGGDDPNERSTFKKPSSGQELGRDRVKVYSVWIRDTQQLRVLVETDTARELYPARDYYGPPSGPYELFDAYTIPGQTWPLSPLQAVNDQSLDLNIHARSMGRSAARRKHIGLVESANPDLGEKLADAEDGEFVTAKGISGEHAEIEVGGVTEQQYTYTEYIRSRLDRVSGLTATVQGAVGDADTATEAQIADDALGNRIRWLRNQVLKATSSSLYSIGWFLYHTEGIIVPVNRRDPYTMEETEGLFFGGPMPTDEGAVWDDFNVNIQPYSMQRESEETMQQRMLQFFEIFTQIAQMAPTMPWVRWMNVLRDLGETFRMEDKASEWMIPEVFGSAGQPQMSPPSMVLGQADPGEQAAQYGSGSTGNPDPNARPGAPVAPGRPGSPAPGGMGVGGARQQMARGRQQDNGNGREGGGNGQHGGSAGMDGGRSRFGGMGGRRGRAGGASGAGRGR